MRRLRLRHFFTQAGVLLATGLAALAFVSSCSGGGDESLVSPCEKELECGQPCSAQAPCGSGRFCGNDKTCVAECVRGDSRCGQGETCDANGRCVKGINLGVGGSENGGGGSSTGGSTGCIDFNVSLEKQTPTVLLLIDQSDSMRQPFGNGNRWGVLHQALMNMQQGIVNRLQAEVRFGLALYSGVDNMPCPAITDVAPALNNYAAINGAYPAPMSAVLDNTPTGESLEIASQTLQDFNEPGQKVIVLATDGDPDSCAEPDSNGTQPPRNLSLQAAEAAFEAGVFTFVISVGNDATEAHLQELANVGQGYPRNDNQQRFYLANDQAQLADAFNTIINGVRSCVFPLNGTVMDGAEDDGTVTLDGMLLNRDDPNGWRLSSPTTIELQGNACETIKMGDHDLSVRFPCGAFRPDEPA
jgi:hypothetical protein